MASYYTLLTVSPHASVADIKSKYRQLSLRYHPDSGGSTEKMVELNEAYHTLSNPLLRREYDQRLSPAKPSATYAYSAPSSSYYPPQQPTYRPTPTTRPDYTSPPGYTRRRQDEYVKEKSSFWSWFGVLALIVMVFLGYQLLTFLQPTSSTSIPTTTSSIPTTTSATPTSNSTETDSTNESESTTPNIYRTTYSRRYANEAQTSSNDN
jgi:curved DNA-binding protein CbpA